MCTGIFDTVKACMKGSCLNMESNSEKKKPVISNDLLKLLTRHEISPEKIIYSAKLDRNREGVYLENHILFTAEKVYLIGYITEIEKSFIKRASGMFGRIYGSIFGAHSDTAVCRINEISFYEYDIDEIDEIRTEEMISGFCLTARRRDSRGGPYDGNYDGPYNGPYDNYFILSYLTCGAREAAELTARVFNAYKKTGELPSEPADDDFSDGECPRCGRKLSKRPEQDIAVCPKCSRASNVVMRFLSFLGKYRYKVIAIALCLFASAGLSVVTPYVSTGFYYDKVLTLGGEFYGNLFLVVVLLVGTRLLTQLVEIANGVVSTRVAADIIYDLKKTIFSAFERLSVSFFTGRQTGGLMQQVDGDSNTIYWLFCEGFPYFCINVIEVVAVFVIMLTINVRLTLLSVVTIPVVIICWKLIYSRIRSYNAKSFTASRTLRALISDLLTGMRVVKTFAKEEEEGKRFDFHSKDQADAEYNASFFWQKTFPLSYVLLYASNIAALGFGGWSVIQGGMTYGSFFTFITYINFLYNPMFYFFNVLSAFSDSVNAMQRMMEIMDAEPDVVEDENPVNMPQIKGEVSFEDVSFAYVGSRKVLENISFHVNPGETLGIVGHTGAGKSTIANLLIRLYDPVSGRITIDGVPTKKIALSDLRREVSIVSQETYLFVGSVYDNIAYARPDASRGEVVSAAKIAGAHDFIMKLPDAYQTRVGHGYMELSGGERQRVSIARAILRNPKILILDEATAAMDTQTERMIQFALEKLSHGRTTIIIAHRLSTLRNADKIIVIDGGKIPESGTHEELIGRNGIYYKLYKYQLDALKNIGIEE